MDWITIVGIAVSGSLALAGVGIGAFLTPYFEARWAKKRRAEELHLNTLIELQDSFTEWFEVAARYRQLRLTAKELGNPREFFSLDIFKDTMLAHNRLLTRVLALSSRLIDDDISKSVAMAVNEATEIIASALDDEERFDKWIALAGHVCTDGDRL